MVKHILALIVQAAVVLGARNDGVADISISIGLGSTVGKRSLSQPRPTVDRCWGEVETNDETENKTPSIKCEFDVPKGYNSASDIKRGTCSEFNEPACESMVDDECVGPFILGGKIITAAYLDIEISPDEIQKDQFDHTYCARADVYQDIDNSGKQTSIAHVTKQLEVNFIVDVEGNTIQYLLDVEMDTEPSEQKGNPTAAIIGTLIGILIIIPILIFFLKKRRNKGGLKIHESADTVNDDESMVAGSDDAEPTDAGSDVDDSMGTEGDADDAKEKDGVVEIV